jgi:two-component system, NtrC family, sensor kinase
MTMRTRTFLACVVAALLPLAGLALGARREVHTRLSQEFEARVAASSSVLRQDLATQAVALDARLAAIAGSLASEPSSRAALLQQQQRLLLIDAAPAAMATAGLDYLLIIGPGDTVLSAGHFRSDYGRSTAVGRVLPSATEPALVAARRPQGAFLALTRAHATTIGAQRFVVVGGIEVDSTFVRALVRDTDGTLTVSLDYPGGSLFSRPGAADAAEWGGLSEQIAVPFIDDIADPADAFAGTAAWTITHSLAPLRAVQRTMDRWFLAAAAAAVLLAFISARVLAARVSHPLEELARRSTRVDLERMDVRFATRRRDEIGTLSRMLDAMVQRLRAAATQLRDAERRATVGDMARQVNHDVRNGLLPIKNVVHHLSEVAAEEPAQLAAVFDERRHTLSGGIDYLEKLAASYARLAPRNEEAICDVNEMARAIARDLVTPDGVRVSLELSAQPVRVAADPVALRRIIENLMINAVESIDGPTGAVMLRTLPADGNGRGVVISVADTGAGIADDDLDRIFSDFFTTKAHGTGLGLSIVRRLAADMGGRVTVESQPRAGTTFHIELPELP